MSGVTVRLFRSFAIAFSPRPLRDRSKMTRTISASASFTFLTTKARFPSAPSISTLLYPNTRPPVTWPAFALRNMAS